MNSFTFDESVWKKLYEANKEFLLPLTIVLVCIMLVFLFIIPQIQQINNDNAELKDIQAQTQVLQDNAKFLSSINEVEQEKQVDAATKALPSEKDFAGMLYAIRNASAKAAIGLGDFTLRIGDLSEKTTQQKTPSVSIEIDIAGGPQDAQRFIEALAKTSPVSQVIEVSSSQKTTTLSVQFYYKPVTTLSLNFTKPLHPLSAKLSETLNITSAWNRSQEFDVSNTPVASRSGSLFQ